MEEAMKKTVCVWCSAFIKVEEPYNDLQHKAVCSVTCQQAEMMFTQYWSDEEINQRMHYQELTREADNEAQEA